MTNDKQFEEWRINQFESTCDQLFEGNADTARVVYDAARKPLEEENIKLRTELSHAAMEINASGPVDQRIRLLKKEHGEEISRLKEENERLTKEAEQREKDIVKFTQDEIRNRNHLLLLLQEKSAELAKMTERMKKAETLLKVADEYMIGWPDKDQGELQWHRDVDSLLHD